MRTSMASVPPISRKISDENKNWMPMILWSVEKMYLRMNPNSWPWPAVGVALVLIGKSSGTGNSCGDSAAFVRRPLLGGRLAPVGILLGGLEPGQEVILGRVDVELAAHQRVPGAAVVGAAQG